MNLRDLLVHGIVACRCKTCTIHYGGKITVCVAVSLSANTHWLLLCVVQVTQWTQPQMVLQHVHRNLNQLLPEICDNIPWRDSTRPSHH